MFFLIRVGFMLLATAILFLASSLVNLAYSQGEPITRAKGEYSSSFNVSPNILLPANQVSKAGGITTRFETGNLNVFKNWSFEGTLNYLDFDAVLGSGTDFTVTRTNTEYSEGAHSALVEWDNATGTFDFTHYLDGVAGNSLAGASLNVSMDVKTTVSGLDVCYIVAGVPQECVDVVPDGVWHTYTIPGVYPGTGTSYGIRLKNDSAVTGIAYVDKVGTNIVPLTQTSIAQAQLAGAAYFPGNSSCAWTRTSTTQGPFSPNSVCLGPTILEGNIGSWQNTDVDLPIVTVNNLPAGKYVAEFVGYAYGAATNTYSINDGTTTCQSFAGNPSSVRSAIVRCVFNYTTPGNRSFQLYCAAQSGSCNVFAGIDTIPINLHFSLTYYPPPQDIISDKCNDLRNCETEFTAKISSTCTVSDETPAGFSWINGNCTLSSTSICTCTLDSGVFSQNLNCSGNTQATPSSSFVVIPTSSSSSLVTEVWSDAGTRTAQNLSVKCTKTGSDYLNSKVNRILAVTKKPTAILKDVKSSGTNGGGSTGGSYVTRELNTLEGDSGFVSLASNQFTLLPGEYLIEASAPANGAATDAHKIKLRNITDSTDEGFGDVQFLSVNSTTVSSLKVKITISSPKTYAIQHRVTASVATFGLGRAAGFGDSEVYTQVKITKLR